MVTVTPSSYDFGDVVVQAPQESRMFEVQIPRGAADSVRVSIIGPDAGDFKADASTGYVLGYAPAGARGPTCRTSWPGPAINYTPPLPGAPPLSSAVQPPALRATNQCGLGVVFIPRTAGPKTATLVVSEPGGAAVTAALKGNGVAGCTSAVVSCNYAFLYSGAVSWTEAVTGPAGKSSANVNVTVKNGVGVCNGSATSVFIDGTTGKSRSKTGPITGKALVAVEFDFYEALAVDRSRLNNPPRDLPLKEDEADRRKVIPLGYKVTVACPSPDWPGSADEAPMPSTPAEFDGRERSSYPRPAYPLMQRLIEGTNTANPEDDALNGVTGTVTVNWKLTRP